MRCGWCWNTRRTTHRWAAAASIAAKIGCAAQTLHEWVGWFNHRRLLEPIGNIPPAEAEEHVMLLRTRSIWQRDSHPMASGKPAAVYRGCYGRLELAQPGVCCPMKGNFWE